MAVSTNPSKWKHGTLGGTPGTIWLEWETPDIRIIVCNCGENPWHTWVVTCRKAGFDYWPLGIPYESSPQQAIEAAIEKIKKRVDLLNKIVEEL